MAEVSISIAGSKADRVRLLAERHPYFTPRDIAQLTGFRLIDVESALKRKRRDRVKSRR